MGITKAMKLGTSWFRLPDFVERLRATPNDDAEYTLTLEPDASVLSTTRRRSRGQDEDAADEEAADIDDEAPQQDRYYDYDDYPTVVSDMTMSQMRDRNLY